MNNSFRDFLDDVKDRLFPDESATVLEPESPPNWKRLGWKTGWIVEEGHTGLQWWVTDEGQWDPLAEPFGQSKRQRNQAFSRWYKSLLDEYRRILGVPLKLESVRWRQMDMAAFEGRPLIEEEEDWWCVGFEGTRGGRWDLILSERFIQLFEEDTNRSPEPDPPWTFLELWQRIDPRGKRQLLGCIGTDTGLLNHLSALVIAGVFELDSVRKLMQRQPTEEFETVLNERRENLRGLSDEQKRQTVDQWKSDAINHLTERVGEWLMGEKLDGSEWSELRAEWKGYRENLLEGTFGDQAWVSLWRNLEDRDFERLVPRLKREELSLSFVGVVSDVKPLFETVFPDRRIELIFGNPPASSNRIEVLRARESVYGQLRSVLSSSDHDLVGEFQLGED